MQNQRSIDHFFGSGPSKKKQRVDEDGKSVDTSEEAKEVTGEGVEEAKGESKEESKGKEEEETEEDSFLTEWAPFNQIEIGWRRRLFPETRKAYFQSLYRFVDAERGRATVFPPEDEVFSVLNVTPFDQLKVVVIGQDPYHGPGQAHGMAFSVKPGVSIPPSLRNIIKEAQSDVGIRKPSNGYLMRWSEQGVLLLNAVLTVRRSEANSHQKKGWEQFTDAIIKAINKGDRGVVFLLWGKPAQKKCKDINLGKHRVIMSSHPSPLGATKTNAPFISSRCFSRCNRYLEELGHEPIDWEIESA
jgi:uracil-DNA glycosylase